MLNSIKTSKRPVNSSFFSLRTVLPCSKSIVIDVCSESMPVQVEKKSMVNFWRIFFFYVANVKYFERDLRIAVTLFFRFGCKIQENFKIDDAVGF